MSLNESHIGEVALTVRGTRLCNRARSAGQLGQEMIRMPLYVQASGGQNFRKAFSEVTVGEKDAVHAARS